MAAYDPNQNWTPPGPEPGYTTVPVDSEPTTGADRWALIAVAVSLTVLGSCIIPGFSCLAPLVVGIVALTQAKNAANPSRARTYGWIATGIGIFVLVVVLAIIGLYGAVIIAAINEANNNR